jgi:hypothetical protein
VGSLFSRGGWAAQSFSAVFVFFAGNFFTLIFIRANPRDPRRSVFYCFFADSLRELRVFRGQSLFPAERPSLFLRFSYFSQAISLT